MMPSIILKSDDEHLSMHPERRGAAAATCYMAPDGTVTTRWATPLRFSGLPGDSANLR